MLRRSLALCWAIVWLFVASSLPAAAQLPPGSVTTDCAPCAGIAAAYNEALAEFRRAGAEVRPFEDLAIRTEGEIAAAKEALAAAEAEGAAQLNRREELKETDPASSAAADTAQRAAFDRVIELMNHIEQRLEPRAEAARRQVDALFEQMRQQLAQMDHLGPQLAECEKQCLPSGTNPDGSAAGPGGGAGPGSPIPGSRSTDCEPCTALARQYNDALAEFRRAGEDLFAVDSALQDVLAQIAATEASIAGALAEADAATQAGEGLRNAGSKDAAAIASADAAKDAAYARANELTRQLEVDLDPRRDQLDEQGNELLTQLAALANRMDALAAELTECEKQCAAAGPAEQPATGIPEPEAEPQPVDPDGFVTTNCAPCRQIASDLNEVLRGLIAKRAEAQSLTAAIPELEVAIEDAELDEKFADGDFRLQLAMQMDYEREGNEQARKAAVEKGTAAFERFEKAQADIQRLTAELEAARQRLDALEGEIEQLAQREAELRAALEECEKQCTAVGPEEQSSTGIPGGGAEPASDFVTTDCPACERIVALLNDVIGSLKTLPGQIAEAQAELDEVKAKEAEIDSRRADAQARFEASLQQGENLRTNNPGDSAGIAAADTAKNEASAEVRAIEAELMLYQLLHVDPAQQKLDTLQRQLDEYKKLEAELRAQLDECEKQCKAAEEAKDQLSTPGATPETTSPFATTDCPACENIVSQLNDTIGTLMNLPGQIAEAQQALADAEARAEENAEALAGAIAALDAAIQAGETLRQSATPDADAIAEADAATRKASADLRRQMEAPGDYADVLAARQRLEALGAYLEQQKAREADLRAQLAECEKQCKAAEEAEDQLSTPGVTPQTASPFVKTDCPACEAIASLLNDMIGSLQNMPGQIAAARQALADAEAQAEENDEALAGAIAALDAAIQVGETLRQSPTPDADAIEAADAATRKASDDLRRQMEAPGDYADVLAARQRLDALEAQLEQLKALEAELRAELAECETQCQQAADPQSAPDLEPILDAGVITTDCPACEDLAAALNATAASLKAASEAMDAASAAYDEARRAGDKAMEGAGAALEAGGQYANDATLALNAGDQTAADVAVAGQEEAFTEASELLDEADQHGLDAEAAKAALDDATAKVNELRDLFNEQAKALEECEQQCHPMEPNLEVKVSLQDAACERGEECTLVISLTNRADQPHEGPGFISADMRFGVGVEGGLVGGAFCGWAPKGGSICSVPADELEEGGTLTLVVPVQVPDDAPEGSDFCAAVEMPEYGDTNSVGAAIQLGLLEKGFPLGTIDGVIGPKSEAAIDGYLQAEDAPAGYADEGGESEEAPLEAEDAPAGYAGEGGEAEEDPLEDDEPPSGVMPWTASGMSEDEIIEMFGSVLPEEAARGYAELYRRLFDAPPPQRAGPAFDPGPDCVPLGLPVLPKAAPRLPGDEAEDEPAPVRRNNAPGVTIEFGFDDENGRHREEEEEEPRGIDLFGPDGGGLPDGIKLGF